MQKRIHLGQHNYRWIAAFLLVLVAQITLLFYYGGQKSGFHEDEFYSFYSSNRTTGLFQPDREWVPQENYRNEFVVLPGEGFHYGLVTQVQSWDVHPPLFYWILHTVCSLFPGVFSKWLGIVPNIFAFAINYALLALLSWEWTGKKRIAFAACLFWGFGAAVISGVMFIRMYEWLTLFVLLCTWLHIRAMKRAKFTWTGFYIPLMATVYLGFLTQYYYIIFHIFMGAGFCIWLLWGKRIKELGKYVAACALSLGLAILTYPACLTHIFKGYRGTEAVAEFSNAANTVERLHFFGGLINDYVFAGYGGYWLLGLCLLSVTVMYGASKQKRPIAQVNSIFYLLVFTCMGYFVAVAKSALLLGETSNRYQLPIYGLLILLFLFLWMQAGDQLLDRLLHHHTEHPRRQGLIKGSVYLVLLVLLFTTDLHALAADRVFFLYKEEKANMEYAKENADTPVVIFYHDATPYNVWRLADELMEYPRVYMVDMADTAQLTDEEILHSEKLVVYIADYENQESYLEGLLEVNSRLTEYEKIADKELWTIYEFH